MGSSPIGRTNQSTTYRYNETPSLFVVPLWYRSGMTGPDRILATITSAGITRLSIRIPVSSPPPQQEPQSLPEPPPRAREDEDDDDWDG